MPERVRSAECPSEPQANGLTELSGLTFIAGHFNEIAIRISEVEGDHRTNCPCSLNWTFENFDTHPSNMLHGFFEPQFRDKAQIFGARLWRHCLGIEFFSELMQVDFLAPELQRDPPVTENIFRHPQHRLIEVYRGINVFNGEHDVVYS